MSNLRKKTIKLAFENPELRPILLPLLKEAAEFDPKEIGEDHPGALVNDPEESYMKDHFTQNWFHELDDLQESGKLEDPKRIREVDEDATLPAMESKRAGDSVGLFADFDPEDIGKPVPGPVPGLEDEFTQEEWSGMDEALRNATIRLAHTNPELRPHLLPLLKESAAEKGTFKCPECGSKVLKATKYCLKCKKKVEEPGGKSAGCEKLPKGPMRDNCEKSKEDGGVGGKGKSKGKKKDDKKKDDGKMPADVLEKFKAKKKAARLAELRAAAAKPKSISDLPAKEQKVAKGMMAKGYTICAQILSEGKNHGEPLYFKTTKDLASYLRWLPDYTKAKTAWNFVMKGEG